MKVFCKGAKATIISDKMHPVTGGSENYYKMTFVFTHEWDKFTKTAMFFNNKKSGARFTQALTQVTPAYSVFPNYEIWECKIPNDVLISNGTLYAGVIGVSGTGATAITLNSTAVFRDIDFGISDISVIQNPSSDVYAQLLEELAKIQRESQADWNQEDTASIQYILNKDDVNESTTWDVVDDGE